MTGGVIASLPRAPGGEWVEVKKCLPLGRFEARSRGGDVGGVQGWTGGAHATAQWVGAGVDRTRSRRRQNRDLSDV